MSKPNYVRKPLSLPEGAIAGGVAGALSLPEGLTPGAYLTASEQLSPIGLSGIELWITAEVVAGGQVLTIPRIKLSIADIASISGAILNYLGGLAESRGVLVVDQTAAGITAAGNQLLAMASTGPWS